MELNFIDYTLITFFFLAVLVIGLVVSKKAGKDTSEFFFQEEVCHGGYLDFLW